MPIPLVISSPHSGENYPQEFLENTRLPLHVLQQTEDRFVNRLFERASVSGATVLASEFPRIWCDVNRDPRELDAGMFQPRPPEDILLKTAKVKAGFGVIPRLASRGLQIYRHCLPVTEIEHRLELCWRPYHGVLSDLLQTLQRQFGTVILLEAHSMPPLPYSRTCDVVLGDRHGQSCAPELTAFLEKKLMYQGYAVRRNIPYAGGYITSHYGKPVQGIHAIQLEICRQRYLNLGTMTVSRNFEKVQQDMTSLVAALAEFLKHQMLSVPA